MRVDGVPMRTIWPVERGRVGIIDQTRLPHEFVTVELATLADAAHAIRAMLVRGAPLIGATAAYGVALALAADPSDSALAEAVSVLAATRPTAINLRWALEEMRATVATLPPDRRATAAWARAAEIAEADVALNRAIGQHGLALIEEAWVRQGRTGRVDVLTHCNAGWLATVDWGTALAPIFTAHDRGLSVHVWVDETRPRNQGASLTAWELLQHGVPHTVIADNAGGHLMQRGEVDLCIVGTDRTTAIGDVANKNSRVLTAANGRAPEFIDAPRNRIDRHQRILPRLHDVSGRADNVGFGDGLRHFIGRHVIGLQALRFQIDDDAARVAAEGWRRGYAGQCREQWPHAIERGVLHFRDRTRVA